MPSSYFPTDWTDELAPPDIAGYTDNNPATVPAWKRAIAGFGAGYNNYYGNAMPSNINQIATQVGQQRQASNPVQLYTDRFGTNAAMANEAGGSTYVNDHYPLGFVQDSLSLQGFNPNLLQAMTVGFATQKPDKPNGTPSLDSILGKAGYGGQSAPCVTSEVFGHVCQDANGMWKNDQGETVLQNDGTGTMGGDMTNPNRPADSATASDTGNKWVVVILAVAFVLIGISLIK